MPAFMKLGDIKGEATDADSVGPDGGTIVLGTNARETTTASFTSTAGATTTLDHKRWSDLTSFDQMNHRAQVSPDGGTIVLGTNARETTTASFTSTAGATTTLDHKRWSDLTSFDQMIHRAHVSPDSDTIALGTIARDTTAPTTTSPDDGVVDGRDFSVLTSALRPEFQGTGGTERDPFDTSFSGGVVVAAGETRSGGTVADDVIVDGRIITAGNWDSTVIDPGMAEEIFRSYLIEAAEPRAVGSGGANVALADGSVRFVPDSVGFATDAFTTS